MLGIDFFVGEDVVADFLAVVDDVPELLFHFPHFFFCESGGYECAVLLLIGSDEDEAAVGVGECGVGLPQAVRKSSFGFLGFETVVFPIFITEVGYPKDSCNIGSEISIFCLIIGSLFINFT